MHSSVNETIGGQVARLRKLRGDLSQVGLAGLLSTSLGKVIDPSTVNRLERGKRPVTADELLALCEVFEVPVTELLTEPDPIRSALAHWRSFSRTTEAKITEVSAQLARLNQQAAVDGEIIEAFTLLDISRHQQDRDSLVRAVELLQRHARLLPRVGMPSGTDEMNIWAALELAGVAREVIDQASKQVEERLAPWLSGDDAIDAAIYEDERLRESDSPTYEKVQQEMLKSILEGLCSNGSQ